jgi:integrase/recombinase XerD
MNSHITLSQAIEGYLLDARARQLSPRTIGDYIHIFHRFQDHVGNVAIAAIEPNDVRRFLANLRSHRVTPNGVAPRPSRILSKKTVRNHYIALASLWTWATSENIADRHVVRAIDPPPIEKPAIEPFSKSDVELLLDACDTSRPYTRLGKRECANRRPTADRDRALILLLLDTGARASEVCAEPRKGAPGLLVGDLDQRNSHVTVMGKGDKGRILPISAPTSKALWRYLTARPDSLPSDPLILSSRGGGPFTTAGLLCLVRRLGDRAGVPGAHPHRFRHTFAINFLRNGGNALELQRLLGHSTLEMVNRYVALAQVDLDNAHRRASPVVNWRL